MARARRVETRDALGKLVATMGMARRRDRDERAVDREAVPQHAIDDVLSGMEHADRLGSLEQVEGTRFRSSVVRLLLSLHPAAPPGGSPAEGGVLERQPRQRVERFERTRAEVVVETGLRAVGSGWKLQHADLCAATFELLAEREGRLQEIRTGPDVGVRDDDGLALVPVDAVEVRDRPAAGLPVPEPADRDAGESFLARLERLLLPLGDKERRR